MGCSASVVVNGHVIASPCGQTAPFLPIPISDSMKSIILQTWKLVEPVKVAAGKKLFARSVLRENRRLTLWSFSVMITYNVACQTKQTYIFNHKLMA